MDKTFLGKPNQRIIDFLRRSKDDKTNVSGSKWTAHVTLTDLDDVVRYDDNIVLDQWTIRDNSDLVATSDGNFAMTYYHPSKRLILSCVITGLQGVWNLIYNSDQYNKQKIIQLEKQIPTVGHVYLTINAAWSRS